MNPEAVKEYLAQLGISYQTVEHPAVFTTEDADKYIEGLEGVRTKTMFMTDKKKKHFYLLIMDDNKRLDFREFQELIDAKGVKMASPETLMLKMGVIPGVVSVFNLLNNKDKDVQVYFDHDIMSEKTMTFHPNMNTETIFVATPDILKFVESLGYDYQILNF